MTKNETKPKDETEAGMQAIPPPLPCSPRYFARAWHPIHPEYGPDMTSASVLYESEVRENDLVDGWRWVECVVIDKETFEKILSANALVEYADSTINE